MTWFRGNVIDNQILNMVGVGTASGAIASFDTDENNRNLLSCEVAIVAQQASGTPSPSSPLPITGFSSVALSVGVNIWDETWEVGAIDQYGDNTINNNRIRTKGFIKVIPSNTYYIKSPNNMWIWGYDDKKVFKERIPDTSAISNRTITIPSGVYYIRFVVIDAYGTTYNNDISINYPSTDTAYHHSTTTPVSLGQTIYGGTAELVGGNGTKTFEHGSIDGTEADSAYGIASSQPVAFYRLPNNCVNFQGLCNKAVNAGSKSFAQYTDGDFTFYGNAFYFYYNGTKTISDLKTYIANTIGGYDFIYELATPTAFTFTGANIPTLSGTNNVYTDSGDINSLEYLASIGKILLG